MKAPCIFFYCFLLSQWVNSQQLYIVNESFDSTTTLDSLQKKHFAISFSLQFFDNDNGIPYYQANNRYKNSIAQIYITGPFRFAPLISAKFHANDKLYHEIGIRFRTGGDAFNQYWETDFKELFFYYQLQFFLGRSYFPNRLKPYFGLQSRFTHRNIYSKLNLGFMTDTYTDKLYLYSINLPFGFNLKLKKFYLELEGILNLGGYVSGKYITHGTNLTQSSNIDERGNYKETFFIDKLSRANLLLNTFNLKIGYYLPSK